MKNKCVYLHKRKSDGYVFYVGMGSIKRAYDKSRNKKWHEFVKDNEYYVEILKTGMSSAEAHEMEKELINIYSHSITNIHLYKKKRNNKTKTKPTKIKNNKTFLFIYDSKRKLKSSLQYSKTFEQTINAINILRVMTNLLTDQERVLMNKSQLHLLERTNHFLENVKQGTYNEQKCLTYEARY